jgi:hypothetical protein
MAFEAFATVDDLLEGWPNKTLNESETAAANALLLRASAYVATKLAQRKVEIDPEDELQALNLKTVTVNVVRRSMSSGDSEGIASMSQTIGTTTASVQLSNPDGAFWLSQLDKEVLGLAGSGGRAGWADLAHADGGE